MQRREVEFRRAMREGVAVREVGASVRVSILTTAILSCLSQF